MLKPLKLEELTIEQKIGQMLIARPPRSKADKEYIMELIRNKSLGGIQVTGYFRAVTGNSDLCQEDRSMIAEFNEAGGYPILICDDMEFGYSDGSVVLPSPLGLGSIDSEELAYEFARITAIEAKAAGYNVVFGPCLDLAVNPRSSAVGARAFGGDEHLVARMAAAAVKGYQDEGMIVTAKHFPGSGSAAIDNHIRLAPLKKDKERLLKEDTYPFVKLMEDSALTGIMMGQVIVPAIDKEYPATLSAKMNRFLREELGFNGLVITDSFTMVSLRNQFSLEECLRYGMAAGNDMVMTSYREDTRPAYEAMLKAYQDGFVTERQIDAAVEHVLAAQSRTLQPARQKTITEKEYKTATVMFEKSITATVREAESAAVNPKEKYLILIEEGNLCIDPALGTQVQEYEGNLCVAEAEIRKRFVNSDIVKISEFPSRNQMFALLRRSIHYDKIIMVVYNKSIAYTGSSDLTKRLLAYMEGVKDKLYAVVMFGNPYAAREIPFVPRIIYGYDESKPCQEYCIKTLAGEHVATGRMPINLKLRNKEEEE
ncbi:MAG: glycoside hydrolase family 3 protein [Hungatella hathewayi]|nr:glycoside hydrolase family 3 protein [Hungatella hathewayi]